MAALNDACSHTVLDVENFEVSHAKRLISHLQTASSDCVPLVGKRGFVMSFMCPFKYSVTVLSMPRTISRLHHAVVCSDPADTDRLMITLYTVLKTVNFLCNSGLALSIIFDNIKFSNLENKMKHYQVGSHSTTSRGVYEERHILRKAMATRPVHG